MKYALQSSIDFTADVNVSSNQNVVLQSQVPVNQDVTAEKFTNRSVNVIPSESIQQQV